MVLVVVVKQKLVLLTIDRLRLARGTRPGLWREGLQVPYVRPRDVCEQRVGTPQPPLHVHEPKPELCQCAINAAHLRIGYAGPRVGHGQGLKLLQSHVEREAGGACVDAVDERNSSSG